MDERKAVAQAAVDELRRNGDQWKLDEEVVRLVEKVGRIDLHAGEGAGLDALLTRLVRLKADAPA